MYEEFYEDWIKINKVNAILSKENTELKSQVSRLEVILSKKDLELCKVKEELGEATQILAKLNSSSSKLDSLLMIGKNDKAGLGYTNHQYETGESSNTERKPTVFVKRSAEISNTSHTEKGVSSKGQISTKKSKSRKRQFICHYCFRPGHIKPYCFRLRDVYKRWESEKVLPQVLYNTRRNTANRKSSVKRVWVPKANIQCSVIYTSLKTNIAGIWYFDSGCSRHMTGSKDHLIDYVELRSVHVTYGGGAKGRIAGKGTLNVDGLPSLQNVLYVEGLNSNLISISQLCDDGLHFKFDKDICEVFDNANTCILTGTRSADNCYQLGEDLMCNHSKVSELNLWHRKLGHANFKTLKNLGKYDTVRGMPNLSSGTPYVCGACQKDLTGKTIEDDIDGLLNVSETLPNTDVAPGVVTPESTPALAESNDEPGEYTVNDDDVTNEGFDIPSKIQKIIHHLRSLEKHLEECKLEERRRIESVRLLLAIACHMDIKLYQMDVKSAFLNGILNEEAYVSQPKGFEDPNHPNHVYKLKKALYGLKQAPRAWYGRLTEYLLDLGFKQGEYAKNLVKKFSTENTKHMKTPMGSTEKLSKDDVAAGVDNTQYRSIIDSLLYLSASRPDIMFSVCLCARYQADPKVTHLKAVKRILRYISGTVDLGLL
ncbi:uncharacterized protein [Primulina eburnea]|uniref:uncharacterized protein n=1 Tax=Primulina eburnea TaxID=1245227 RepID=UPI003C6C1EFD